MCKERVEILREAKRSIAVTLHNYLQLRNHNKDECIYIFEGNEDYSFYSTLINRILERSVKITPLCVNGKENVLALRDKLEINEETSYQKVLYFIDRDYDLLKGRTQTNNLYMTPSYSIENLLVTEKNLKELLIGEYYCNDNHANEDITKIIELYRNRLNEFTSVMKKTNQLIHYIRVQKIKVKAIDVDAFKKIAKVSLEEVSCLSHDCWQHIGLTSDISTEYLNITKKEFDKLDPVKNWRGKFLYAFFSKFLALLKEDRGKKKPTYFKERKNMTFNPTGDIIRTLASMIEIPICLKSFVKDNTLFIGSLETS